MNLFVLLVNVRVCFESFHTGQKFVLNMVKVERWTGDPDANLRSPGAGREAGRSRLQSKLHHYTGTQYITWQSRSGQY